MKTVIGVFDQRAQAEAMASAAISLGVPEYRVEVMDRSAKPDEWFEPEGRAVALRTLRSFTLMGVALFGVFGLFTLYGAMVATGAPLNTALTLLWVFLVVGLLSGLFMGWVKGRADADDEVHRFREAFLSGKVLTVVETDVYAKAVAQRMRQQAARMVFVSRERKPWRLAVEPEALAAAAAH
ncbi:MAG: hypothetical protein NZ528_16670 [Caldilineales bacterium]|nr:hypothetical protein [Caldilineales bacterium]MDW8316835.1 hypothetical protein [Anaerolineae bacterium]